MIDIFASNQTLIEKGNISLNFMPFDAINPRTDLPYTQNERVAEIKIQYS